jgi:hypothetical protein
MQGQLLQFAIQPLHFRENMIFPENIQETT